MDKPASGSFELPSGESDLGRCGYQLHVELSRLQQVHGFERVYYEAPIPPSQLGGRSNLATVAKVFCIAAHIESYCYAKGLRCRQVGMGAWRRHFVGKGAGEKSATFKSWARERCRQLDWHVRSHDEADACGVLDYAISLDPEFKPPWRDDALLFAPMPVKRRAA